MRSILARPIANALFVLGTALLLGGCITVERVAETDTRVEVGSHLVLDLTDPPTRADLDLPDGQSTLSLRRSGDRPVRVTLRLAPQRQFDVEADWILVDTDGPAGPPTRYALYRSPLDLDQVGEALLDGVLQVGLDAEVVDSTLSQLRAAAGDGERDHRYLTAGRPGAAAALEYFVTSAGRDDQYRLGIRVRPTTG